MADNYQRNIWDILGGVNTEEIAKSPAADRTDGNTSNSLIEGNANRSSPGEHEKEPKLCTVKRRGKEVLSRDYSVHTGQTLKVDQETSSCSDTRGRRRSVRSSGRCSEDGPVLSTPGKRVSPERRTSRRLSIRTRSRKRVGHSREAVPVVLSDQTTEDEVTAKNRKRGAQSTDLFRKEKKSANHLVSDDKRLVSKEESKMPAESLPTQEKNALPFKMNILQRARGLFKNINLDMHGKRSTHTSKPPSPKSDERTDTDKSYQDSEFVDRSVLSHGKTGLIGKNNNQETKTADCAPVSPSERAQCPSLAEGNCSIADTAPADEASHNRLQPAASDVDAVDDTTCSGLDPIDTDTSTNDDLQKTVDELAPKPVTPTIDLPITEEHGGEASRSMEHEVETLRLSVSPCKSEQGVETEGSVTTACELHPLSQAPIDLLSRDVQQRTGTDIGGDIRHITDIQRTDADSAGDIGPIVDSQRAPLALSDSSSRDDQRTVISDLGQEARLLTLDEPRKDQEGSNSTVTQTTPLTSQNEESKLENRKDDDVPDVLYMGSYVSEESTTPSRKKTQTTGCVLPMQKRRQQYSEEGPLDLSAGTTRPKPHPEEHTDSSIQFTEMDHVFADSPLDSPLDLTLKKSPIAAGVVNKSSVSRSRSITTIFRNGSTYSVLSGDDDSPRDMIYNNKGQPVSPVRPLVRVSPVIVMQKPNVHKSSGIQQVSSPTRAVAAEVATSQAVRYMHDTHIDASRISLSTVPVKRNGSSSMVTIHNVSNPHVDGMSRTGPESNEPAYNVSMRTADKTPSLFVNIPGDKGDREPLLAHVKPINSSHIDSQAGITTVTQQRTPETVARSNQNLVNTVSPPQLYLVSPPASSSTTGKQEVSPQMPLLSPLGLHYGGSKTSSSNHSEILKHLRSPPIADTIARSLPNHAVHSPNMATALSPPRPNRDQISICVDLTGAASNRAVLQSAQCQDAIVQALLHNSMGSHMGASSSEGTAAAMPEGHAASISPVKVAQESTVTRQPGGAITVCGGISAKSPHLPAFMPTTRRSRKAMGKDQTFYSRIAFSYRAHKRKKCISRTQYYKQHIASSGTAAVPAGTKHVRGVVEVLRDRHGVAHKSKRVDPSTSQMATTINKHRFRDWVEEFMFYKKTLCRTPAKVVTCPAKIPDNFQTNQDWVGMLYQEIDLTKHAKEARLMAAKEEAQTSRETADGSIRRRRKRRADQHPNLEDTPVVVSGNGTVSNKDEHCTSTAIRSPDWEPLECNTMKGGRLQINLQNEHQPSRFKRDVLYSDETTGIHQGQNKLFTPKKKRKSKQLQDVWQNTVHTGVLSPDDSVSRERPKMTNMDTMFAIIEAVGNNTLPATVDCSPGKFDSVRKGTIFDMPVNMCPSYQTQTTPKPPKSRRKQLTPRRATNGSCDSSPDGTLPKSSPVNSPMKVSNLDGMPPITTKTSPVNFPLKNSSPDGTSLKRTKTSSVKSLVKGKSPDGKSPKRSMKSSPVKSPVKDECSERPTADTQQKETKRTHAQAEQKKRMKKSKILRELVSTDGYIAMERIHDGGDLYAEPSQLSREERALQRALMRFSELDTQRQRQQKTGGVRLSNQVAEKARQLKNRAIKGSPSKKAINRKDGRIVGYLDLPPQIMQSRTRFQSKGNKAGGYHKDRAYEVELEREEQRRQQARSKHGLGFQDASAQPCSVLLSSEEVCQWSSKLPGRRNKRKGSTKTKKWMLDRKGHLKIKGRRRATLTADNPDALDISADTLPKPVVEWTRDDPADDLPLHVMVDIDHDDSMSAVSASTSTTSDIHRVLPPEVKMLKVVRDTGETALHKAARMGYLDAAVWCCRTGHVDVNVRDNAGFSPLHESCATGQLAVAKLLLAYGANVNLASRLDGVRPLHDAVQSDHIEMARLLLAWGADPNISTFSGSNLFTLARSREMKDFLQGYLADLNGPTSTQRAKPWDLGTTDDDDHEEKGVHIMDAVPACIMDPAAEVLFEFSDADHVTTYHLTLDGDEAPNNYMLLWDIQEQLGLTRELLLDTYPDLQVCSMCWADFACQLEECQPQPPCKWLPLDEDLRQECVQLVLYDDAVRRVLGISVETVNGEQLLISDEEEEEGEMDCQVMCGGEEQDISWEYEYPDDEVEYSGSWTPGQLHHPGNINSYTDCPMRLSDGGVVSLSYVEISPEQDLRVAQQGEVSYAQSAQHSTGRTSAGDCNGVVCNVDKAGEPEECSLRISDVCSLAAVDIQQTFGSDIMMTSPPGSPRDITDRQVP